MNQMACKVSDWLANAASSVWAIYLAIVVCVAAWFLWPPTDVFNSFISDVSVVMLFVLQRSSSEDTRKLHRKTDELVRVDPRINEDDLV